MLLKVHLYVKFRMLGITFGTMTRDFDLPLGVPQLPVPPARLLTFNERGVLLTVDLASGVEGA